MKKQLKKATIKAAALTLSASITATALPLTAFAKEDDILSNDGDVNLEDDSQTEESKAVESEKNVSDALEIADAKVDDIKTSENISNHIDTFYGSVLKLLSLNPTNNFDKKISSDSPVEKLFEKFKSPKNDTKDEDQINKKGQS